jgi:hypothetical protein
MTERIKYEFYHKSALPSVGECQGGEVGVGGWVGEHSHRSKERGRGKGFAEGKPGKGITFEM